MDKSTDATIAIEQELKNEEEEAEVEEGDHPTEKATNEPCHETAQGEKDVEPRVAATEPGEVAVLGSSSSNNAAVVGRVEGATDEASGDNASAEGEKNGEPRLTSTAPGAVAVASSSAASIQDGVVLSSSANLGANSRSGESTGGDKEHEDSTRVRSTAPGAVVVASSSLPNNQDGVGPSSSADLGTNNRSDESTAGDKEQADTTRLPSTVPGAVAVASSSPPNNQDVAASSSSVDLGGANSRSATPPIENVDIAADDDDDEEEKGTHAVNTEPVVMMVQATAVEEIVATEVIPEPMISRDPMASDDVTVQHVDIDNYHDGAAVERALGHNNHHTEEECTFKRPAAYKIALVILAVIVFFVVVVLAVFGVFVLRKDEVVDNPEDADECTIAIQLALFQLLQTEGKAWIEFCVASAVLSVRIYDVVDMFQDRYCATQPNPSRRNVFMMVLLLWLLDLCWLLTAIVIIICINMEELLRPSKLWQGICEEDRSPEMDDLKAYYIAVSIRVSMLFFLITARGRLLFQPTACDQITPFWKQFWRVLLLLLDLTMYAMVLSTILASLSPPIRDLEDYVDGLP